MTTSLALVQAHSATSFDFRYWLLSALPVMALLLAVFASMSDSPAGAAAILDAVKTVM